MTLVREDAVGTVKALKEKPGLDIWLCGGSELAASLFSQIDRVVVKQNPFLMGAGKPLFSRSIPKADLRVVSRNDYGNGFSRVDYEICRD